MVREHSCGQPGCRVEYQGAKPIGRKAIENNGGFVLGAYHIPYSSVFGPKNMRVRLENASIL
jgi:hypothetical protein